MKTSRTSAPSGPQYAECSTPPGRTYASSGPSSYGAVDDERLHPLEHDPELLVRMAVERHGRARLEADEVQHRGVAEQRLPAHAGGELECAMASSRTNWAICGAPSLDYRCVAVMIVEQRDYHVYTGKLPELVRLYETEGIPIQQEILGGLVGAFTTDVGALSTYTTLWRYDSFAEREERRARLQADERWKDVPRQGPAAHPHAAEPDPRPDVVLAAAVMGALDGKVAIVTGGAQGIGAAIAAGLAAEGATRRRRRPRTRRERRRSEAPTSTSDEEDVARMVEETLARHGRIDILVNNAGLYASLEMRAFTEIPLEEWNRVMEVNVASMFLTCRAVVPVMREQGGGKIVNISSGTPFRGVPFLLHYVTSKGAIVALTRALAKELGKDSIHVNCVAPGFTMSDGVKSHPEVIEKLRDVSVASRTIQRDQVPEDVVGAVVFLCTPAADFITGQTMVIDGGQYFH